MQDENLHADVVLRMSRGSPGQWFPESEYVCVYFTSVFLHGDALALYLEMSNEDQVRAEQIEMRLVTAFTGGPFEAYEKLK